jgi:hypothetical protein
MSRATVRRSRSTNDDLILPSTPCFPNMSSPTENPLVQITLCLVACYIVVQIFSPSPSPSSVSAPSLPSPPPSAILANDLDHLNEAAHLPSSHSPGDLAAYNFFCHDPSSLVESIRSGTRPASAQARLPPSVASSQQLSSWPL